MSVSVSTLNEGNTLTIKVTDRFDLHLHKEFRDCYRNEKSEAKYIIDLSNTSYIDSSALGMLLLLREFAGGERANISISGCNEKVHNILSLAQFDRLFKCSDA